MLRLENGVSIPSGDARYLRLDTSNGPLTGELDITRIILTYPGSDTYLLKGILTYSGGAVNIDYFALGHSYTITNSGNITGASYASANTQAQNTNITDNFVFTNGGGDEEVISTGNYATLTWGGSGQHANSTIAQRGFYAIMTSNLGTVGDMTKTGFRAHVAGTADTNVGFYSEVSGGTANYAFYNVAGSMFMGGDNIKTYWGSGITTDSYIEYTGTELSLYSVGGFNFGAGNITTSGSYYGDGSTLSGMSPMVYPDSGIALSNGSGWDSSIANDSSNWNTAYGWGNHGDAGYFSSSSQVDHNSTTNYSAAQHVDWTNATSKFKSTITESPTIVGTETYIAGQYIYNIGPVVGASDTYLGVGWDVDSNLGGSFAGGSNSFAYYSVRNALSVSTTFDDGGGSAYAFYVPLEFTGSVTADGAIDFGGLYVYSTANLGTTGTTGKFGTSVYLAGTADVNIGASYNVSGATVNKAINIVAGNVHLLSDSVTQYFGAANDASINFDGDSLNIIANLVTGANTLNITAASVEFGTTPLNTTGAVATGAITTSGIVTANGLLKHTDTGANQFIQYYRDASGWEFEKLATLIDADGTTERANIGFYSYPASYWGVVLGNGFDTLSEVTPYLATAGTWLMRVSGNGEIEHTGIGPSYRQIVKKASTGGFDFNFFEPYAWSTTGANVPTKIGAVGIYGDMDPAESYYIFMGAHGDTDYNTNATLKIDALDRVGINIPSNTRPAYTLDVYGDQQILMTATQRRGIYVDGITNDFTGVYTATSCIVNEFRRDYNCGSGTIPENIVNVGSYLTIKHTNAELAASYTYGMNFTVYDTGTHTNTTAVAKTMNTYGMQGTILPSGIIDATGTGGAIVQRIGISGLVSDTTNLKDTGASGTTRYLYNYGIDCQIVSNPTVTSGTWTIVNKGLSINVTGTTAGSSSNYGIYITAVSGADSNYGLYDASLGTWVKAGGDLYWRTDGSKWRQGAGDDVYLSYTGTYWDFYIAAATTAIRFNQGQLDTDFIVYGDTAAMLTLDAGDLSATFGGHVSTPAGTSAGSIAKIGGTIKDHYADVGSTTGGETDIYTYTTPANTISTDGDKIIATYSVNFANNANNKQIKVYFAGTQILDTGTLGAAYANQSWRIDVLIIRTSSTTARACASMMGAGGLFGGFVIETDLTGEDWTATNIIKVTGIAATANNDVLGKLGTVSWQPAA